MPNKLAAAARGSAQKVWSALGGYSAWLRERGYAAGTLRAYLGEMQRFSAFCCLSSHTLDDLVEAMVRYISIPDLGLATRKRRMAAMRNLSHFLQIPPPIVRDLSSTFISGRLPRCRVNSPSKRFHRDIWRRDRAIALIVLHTGFSASAIAQLTTRHVCIEQELVWFDDPRNGSRHPVTRQVREALLDWLRVRPVQSDDVDVVFTNRRGLPLSVRTIRQGIRRTVTIDARSGSCRTVRRAMAILAHSGDESIAGVAGCLVDPSRDSHRQSLTHEKLEQFWRLLGRNRSRHSSDD